MNAEQLRVCVAWLRGIVAEEASRTQAKIESYERGCRRATDWIADREVELGAAGMHPSAAGYPKQLAAAWGKYVEYQTMLAKLKPPIAAPAEPARTSRRFKHYRARLQGCIASIPTATGNLLDHYLSARDELQAIVDEEMEFLSGPPVPPPVELRFKPSKKDEIVEIAVGEVAPGIWCEGTRISVDNSGYGGPAWSFGKRYATEAEAWNEAVGNLAQNLRNRHRQPESVKKALAWLDGVAAERGVGIDAQLERMKLELQALVERNRAARKAEAAEAADAEEPIAEPVAPEPFHAHLDLGRTLGAGIQILRIDDFWQVRHDCSWGNGAYSIQHHGRFPTQRAAYDHAVMRIRKTAQWAIEAGDSVRLMARLGEPDVRRAKQILAWLDGLVPPGPDEVAETVINPAPLAPPKRIYLGAPASPVATIAVAPNEDGRWSQASVVHLGIHGYDDFALDVGPTFETEEEAWETAIRKVHVCLSGIKRTSGKTLKYAKGWIDGVARERGIDLREAAEPDLFGAAT